MNYFKEEVIFQNKSHKSNSPWLNNAVTLPNHMSVIHALSAIHQVNAFEIRVLFLSGRMRDRNEWAYRVADNNIVASDMFFDELFDLFGPQLYAHINFFLFHRLIRISVSKQINSNDPILFAHLRINSSPIIGICSEPMHQNNGLFLLRLFLWLNIDRARNLNERSWHVIEHESASTIRSFRIVSCTLALI